MNSQEIKELIDEVKAADQPALQRAQLLASYLQAYHLARIGEELERTNTPRVSRKPSPENFPLHCLHR